MLNPPGPPGSYRPPQSSTSTSFARVKREEDQPEVSEEDQGEFNYRVTKIIDTAIDGIRNAAHEFGCKPDRIAKVLADYLIEHYSLSAPQDSMISTAPKNPDDPDNWRWDLWEERLYTPQGYFVSEEVRTKISFAFHDALDGEKLQSCKNMLPVMKVATASSAYDCDGGYDIVNKFCNNLKPITPLIRYCIQESMFSNEFFKELFKIS